jgi:hypothetical protein
MSSTHAPRRSAPASSVRRLASTPLRNSPKVRTSEIALPHRRREERRSRFYRRDFFRFSEMTLVSKR